MLLKTYTNEPVNVLGEISVKVEYGNQTKILPLIVVEGDGHSLFGRNWPNEIKLNWCEITNMHMENNATEKVKELKETLSQSIHRKNIFSPDGHRCNRCQRS